MSQPCFRVVKLERELVQLESAIGGVRLYAVAQSLHLLCGHGLEILRDPQVLLQHVGPLHTGYGSGHRKAHGVAQGFLGRYGSVFDRVPMPVQRLHAERRNTAAIQFR